jgi:hypothetical protein
MGKAANFRRIEDILNNPADKAKLKNYIDEAVRCKMKIADENESIKNITSEISEKIEIEPKLFKALVNVYHKNNFTEKQQELNRLETAIEMLVLSVED